MKTFGWDSLRESASPLGMTLEEGLFSFCGHSRLPRFCKERQCAAPEMSFNLGHFALCLRDWGEGVHMELMEPEGWRELWERAQAEKDTKKLMKILDEMNRLLTEWENKGNYIDDSLFRRFAY
jgi:hypothetical protein